MTATSSISSSQRPRDFMASALRSMWGSGPKASPGLPKRTGLAPESPPADPRIKA